MLLTQLLAYTFVIMLSTVIYAIYFIIIIMTDRLFLYHLRQVLGLVWDARTEYYNIGLALDLPPGDIDAIVSGNSYKPDPIFTEMIKECLRRGLVTQEKLAKAVSSPQVCFTYLSDCILAEKFTTAPQTPRGKFIFVIS